MMKRKGVFLLIGVIYIIILSLISISPKGEDISSTNAEIISYTETYTDIDKDKITVNVMIEGNRIQAERDITYYVSKKQYTDNYIPLSNINIESYSGDIKEVIKKNNVYELLLCDTKSENSGDEYKIGYFKYNFEFTLCGVKYNNIEMVNQHLLKRCDGMTINTNDDLKCDGIITGEGLMAVKSEDNKKIWLSKDYIVEDNKGHRNRLALKTEGIKH